MKYKALPPVPKESCQQKNSCTDAGKPIIGSFTLTCKIDDGHVFASPVADLPLALPVKNNQPWATIAGGDLCDMALLWCDSRRMDRSGQIRIVDSSSHNGAISTPSSVNPWLWILDDLSTSNSNCV